VEPKAKRGLPLIARDRQQNFARDRNNVGNHHDCQDNSRRQEAYSVRGTLKKR